MKHLIPLEPIWPVLDAKAEKLELENLRQDVADWLERRRKFGGRVLTKKVHECSYCHKWFVGYAHRKYCSFSCNGRVSGKMKVRHGCTNTPEFRSWTSMKTRCLNKNDPNYIRYGGRGITICKRWRHSFENFLKDMGRRPNGFTLGRINNDGNYEPSNCRWETIIQQNRNKRSCRSITYRGETMSPTNWARKLGLGESMVRKRLRVGWPVERILNEPSRRAVKSPLRLAL